MKKLLFSLILLLCLGVTGWGQVAGDFRSTGSTSWNVSTTWNRYSGSAWEASGVGSNNPGQTPSSSSSVYIQSGHTVTLTQNEACLDLNISTGTTNATTGSEGIVALAANTLEINGKLRCYFATVGTIPGTSTASVGPGPITITAAGAGKIKFVGNTRNIVATGEWGAGNTASTTTFALEIALNSNQTATMQVGVKAQNWVISSGILDAGTNRIAADNGSAGGGNVTINSGTSVISSATGTLGSAVIGRTSNAATGYGGTLLVNGTLKMNGVSPTIAMSTITFNGTVEYGHTLAQTLAVLTSGGTAPNIYTNLTLSGGGIKTLGSSTTVNGKFTLAGTTASLGLGAFSLTYGANSTLEYAGSNIQTMTNTEFPASPTLGPKNLTISNTNGVSLNSDKVINGTLSVISSAIFDASTFIISGTGDFDVQAGATIKTAHINGLNGNNTTSGGLSGYSTTANYTFNGSSAQVTGAYLPATVNNLIIDNAAGVTLSNSALTVTGTMTINSGKLFTLETAKQLTVGSLNNNAAAGLVLQSPANTGAPGSLIVDGSISGSGTLKLERYVAAYTGATDGWHLLSSPVNNFVIAGSTFEPGSVDPNIDDLYWYDEATNFWKNYKVGGNFSSFTNGYGYLCSYQTAATKYFTGTPNNADITFSDLTLTSSRGWHAIGNPFQSALKWNDGNWTLTNVNTTAKLLNSGGTYSNLVANDIIPAAQGVFVQVTDATNTITIPKAARTHNTASWNKSGDEILARLRFTAASETDNTFIETDFLFDSQASTSVDERNDGFFLQGIEAAPQMFLKIDDQDLSLKRLPTFNGVYNLHFIKGLSSKYSFSMSGIESLPENNIVTLIDTKTNQSLVLTENPIYSFTSEASDSHDRFLIVFGVVGIGENNPEQTLQAYVSGNQLYVMSTNGKATLQLFDLQGRLVQASQLNGEGLQSQPLNLPAGVYIVRVQNEKAVKSARVVVSE